MKKVCLATLAFVLISFAHAYDPNYVAQHIRKSLNLDTRTEIVVSSSPLSSPFGSLKLVPITLNGGGYQIYLSQDEKQYIWGYPIDLMVDPDGRRASVISLTNVRSKGGPKPPITIVEYTDLQCPFCKKVHDILDQNLYKKYTPKDVRLVFKHYPLTTHAWAEKGSLATECVGEQNEDAFWKMTDKIYAQAVTISTTNMNSKFSDMAKSLNINMDQYNQCFDSGKYIQKIQLDKREGSLVGVNSTPTLFINGRMVRGVNTFEDIQVVIDEKLKEARSKK